MALLAVSSCSNDDDAAQESPATSAASATTVPATADGSTDSSAPATQPGAISEQTTAPTGPSTTTAPTAPPTTGDVTEVVSAPPPETLASTPIDEPAEIVETAEVEISAIERVEAEARLPGEIAGPALAVSVRIANTGSAPIDLSAVTVNLTDATGTVSAPLTAAPAQPLEGELAPGEDAERVFLFEFGDGRSEPITVEVTTVVGAPTAVFVGPIS